MISLMMMREEVRANALEMFMSTPSDTPDARPENRRRSKLFRNVVGGVSAVALMAGIGFAGYAYAVPEQTTAASITAAVSEAPQPQKFGLPDLSSLVEKVKPAVVSVQVDVNPAQRTAAADDDDNQQPTPFQGNPFKGTPFEHFFDEFGHGQQGQQQPKNQQESVKALGSGFFLTADGYAVTNNHVVDGATKIEVVTDDQKTYKAKVVGTDPKTDLALIKVEGRTDFPFVKMAPTMPRIGEWVVAVGNPYGLGGTVTAGIVSAENRDIGSGPYDDYIQIDAAVNRGNSGGPTFNLNGEVIGVNTAIFSPSGGSVGIAFDIPTTTVQSVIPVLKDKGHLERAWLGVQIQTVTSDIAQGLGLEDAAGALVAEPQTDSPAQKAGLKAGDVITKVDGKKIADARDLARQIGSMAPDSKAQLTVIRSGREETVPVVLGAMQDEPQQHASNTEQENTDIGKLGLTVAPASRVSGKGHSGLVVTGVDPSGAAADAGIQAGDVILKVGERDINSAKEMRQALSDAKSHGRNKALVLVKSGGSERYVALPSAAA
jgi:serine protease Do